MSALIECPLRTLKGHENCEGPAQNDPFNCPAGDSFCEFQLQFTTGTGFEDTPLPPSEGEGNVNPGNQ